MNARTKECPYCGIEVPADNIVAQHEHVRSEHNDRHNPSAHVEALHHDRQPAQARKLAKECDIPYVASDIK